jgi:methylmalonyl-CoA/ethylmalonyl-CoA epimerase
MNLSTATIGQLLIPVEHFDRGLAFYRDTLGLPFLFAARPDMAFFQCGDVRLLVGVMPRGEVARRAATIYFRVSDIDAVFITLRGGGVRFRAEPHEVHRTPTSALWLAEFVDPDGNLLALMSEVPLG